MSGHAETIRAALTLIDAHNERDALAALDALLAENQRLADRAVCSGCGSDVDESGICHYEGCDDGEMIPASDLPGALREACDAQSEQWREHAEEIKEMRAEIQRLREALTKLAEASPELLEDHALVRQIAREALAGDTE